MHDVSYVFLRRKPIIPIYYILRNQSWHHIQSYCMQVALLAKHANWQSTANMTCQLAKAKHANWQSTANCKNSTARPNPWKQSKSPNQGNIKFCRTALDTSERRQSNQPVTCQTLKCQTRDSSKPIWFTVSPFCLWNGSWDDHSKTVSLTVRPFCGDIWAGEK